MMKNLRLAALMAALVAVGSLSAAAQGGSAPGDGGTTVGNSSTDGSPLASPVYRHAEPLRPPRGQRLGTDSGISPSGSATSGGRSTAGDGSPLTSPLPFPETPIKH
jgi:hypothetical protein